MMGQALFFSSHKLSTNYAWELTLLNPIRSLKDGITFWNFVMDVSWYKADHNPKFTLFWEILNIVIVEFDIYNVNHVMGGKND